MKIKSPKWTESENGTVRAQCSVETRVGERLLWYELDAKYKDYLTLDRLDAFVAGLILFAMLNKEEIIVDGPISNKLARNLKYYMHIMNIFYPCLHRVSLQTPNLDPLLHCPRGQAVGSSFTTGIDSFCTLWEQLKNEENPMDRISHVINVYAGQRGWGALDERSLFRKKLEPVEEAAKRLNLELVMVDTNLDQFYGFGHFVETFGSRIISCVLLLQKLFSVFYMPSTFKYVDFIPQGSSPLADHLLSTEVLDVVHDGAQHSRIEKTKMISEWKITHSLLTVCNGNDLEGHLNCSYCDKCVRTMITLDMLGVRKQYERVFDFTNFENKRDHYICNKVLSGLVGRKNFVGLWRELKRNAKERGYPLKVKPWKLLGALWKKLKNPSSIKKLLNHFKIHIPGFHNP